MAFDASFDGLFDGRFDGRFDGLFDRMFDRMFDGRYTPDGFRSRLFSSSEVQTVLVDHSEQLLSMFHRFAQERGSVFSRGTPTANAEGWAQVRRWSLDEATSDRYRIGAGDIFLIMTIMLQ